MMRKIILFYPTYFRYFINFLIFFSLFMIFWLALKYKKLNAKHYKIYLLAYVNLLMTALILFLSYFIAIKFKIYIAKIQFLLLILSIFFLLNFLLFLINAKKIESGYKDKRRPA